MRVPAISAPRRREQDSPNLCVQPSGLGESVGFTAPLPGPSTTWIALPNLRCASSELRFVYILNRVMSTSRGPSTDAEPRPGRDGDLWSERRCRAAVQTRQCWQLALRSPSLTRPAEEPLDKSHRGTLPPWLCLVSTATAFTRPRKRPRRPCAPGQPTAKVAARHVGGS